MIWYRVLALFLVFSTLVFNPQSAEAIRLMSSGFETGVDDDLQGSTGTPTVQSTTKRSGTYAAQISSLTSGAQKGWDFQFKSSNSTGPFYTQMALRVGTRPSASNKILVFEASGGGDSSWISLESDGTLILNDEDGVIGSASGVLALDTWYVIDLFTDLTPAAGSEIVTGRLDGTQFATASNRSIASSIRDVLFGGNMGLEAQTTGEWFIDDFKLNDTTGSNDTSYPNTSGKIVHLMPNVAGDNAMGTRGGTDSGSDYGQVDEVPPNDATDYYVLDADLDILDVGIQDSSAGGIGSSDTILMVSVGTRNRSGTAAAATTFKARIKTQSSGTLGEGTTQSHNDTVWKTNGDAQPRLYSLVQYTDPQGGGSFTPTLLDSTQIGVQVVDGTTADTWLSTLWALVEYVPAAGGGEDTSLGRIMRLFEGFTIKLNEGGRIILHQKQ